MSLRVTQTTWGEGTLLRWLTLLVVTITAVAPAAANPREWARFDIPGGKLVDSLTSFGEQCGLQVVYDTRFIEGKVAPAVEGKMPVGQALTRLLRDSGAEWEFVNDKTVVVREPGLPAPQTDAPAVAAETKPRPRGPDDDVTHLEDIRVFEDPRRVLPNEASGAAFGFSKPLLETPRSVSFISQETIDLFGLSAVEDLVRVVPGTFTTTRFGIQGAVDVRNVPADTFFRGMRRISLQGHGRSVLAAMDTIEIVAGPPAPIYGMGKIGGYTNMVPKSGRAQTGSYLEDTQGFVQLIGGELDRREASFGIGGPLTFARGFGKRGGYYVYGLLEDSNSFAEDVPIKQQVLQAATSVDDFAGPFRLEAGVNYQKSRTAGALVARLTQDLVDNGRYVRGTPLAELDANGDGIIGYGEMHQRSPATGTLSANNQPLLQTWAWPTDANGKPLPLDQFPRVSGIPQAMYDYLVAHPEADPTGLLRAQGPGGPLPTSGEVPLGFVLDPRDVGYDTLDLHRSAAFEKESQAQFVTAFFDLIYDTDPGFTIRNQLFFDRMDQHKNSNQPFAQQQEVYAIEDKLTVTRRLERLPSWLRVNSLASFNVRRTVSSGRSAGGDFGTHRTDAMASTWGERDGGMTSETTFATPIDNPYTGLDGWPWSTRYRSQFSEIGLGLLFDTDIGQKANLLIGGRFDGSSAHNVDYAGSFTPNAGTSANPGSVLSTDSTAHGWDNGVSWSTSLSYALTHNVRPYVTWARSSIVLDGNNNMLENAIINAGHIGSAELKEAGIKASLLDQRLFVSLAAYEQARIDVESDDPTETLFAYATATRTEGWTAELKWVPVRNLFLSFYGLHQTTRFEPNMGTVQLVDARTLGFEDVLDAQGNVIYPAEAFLYGGRTRVRLPDGVEAYSKKQGNPDTQFGLNSSFQWNNGIGVTLSGNYFAETCTGRLCTVRLPESYVVNAGALLDVGRWTFKLDVSNLLDERYFRARTGDTLGNVLAQAMPDRRWQFTIKATF
jgi:iron complex outermembrane recepter protein